MTAYDQSTKKVDSAFMFAYYSSITSFVSVCKILFRLKIDTIWRPLHQQISGCFSWESEWITYLLCKWSCKYRDDNFQTHYLSNDLKKSQFICLLIIFSLVVSLHKSSYFGCIHKSSNVCPWKRNQGLHSSLTLYSAHISIYIYCIKSIAKDLTSFSKTIGLYLGSSISSY